MLRASRWLWLGVLGVAGVMLAAALLALVRSPGVSTASPSDGSALIGHVAPDLTVATGAGPIAISSLRGRPAVLNFWASWCVSCRREVDLLNRAAHANGAAATFLGVDIQDSQPAAAGFEGQHPHAYPTGPAVAGSYLHYGVSAPPETFFIDAGGIIRSRVIGPLDEASLDGGLKELGA